MGAAGNKKPKMKASKHGKHVPAYQQQEEVSKSSDTGVKKKL